MIGETMGHYEIIELLGEGGMGKVYRARDVRLERDVAIKVLPASFAADTERLARFEREAKLLATLNHTNIAAIYELADHEDQSFIAMEIVEGDSLAERLAASGPIQVDEALAIAGQIASALEAAHGKGIIHRDLKPANVMVTPSGQVKVLDFGLAKAYETEESGQIDLSHSPTVTMGATRTGMILGTASYMSPEQAKGQILDKRTDIFSFGCLVYEMLTCRKPFVGADVSEILASILKEEPDWELLPQALPVTIQVLLRRCLRKDRDRRLHDIADARIEIEELQSQDPAVSMLSVSAVPESAVGRSRVQLVGVWIVTVVALTLAALAIWSPWASRLGGRGAGVPPVSRLSIPTQPLLIDERVPALAISPEGSRVAYTTRNGGERRLFLRDIDSLDARPIVGSEGAAGPFFSPDGQRVGFAADGELRVVAADGGPPTTLARLGVLLGGHWGEDGSIVYGEWPSRRLWQIPGAGGTPRTLTGSSLAFRYYVAVAPSFLPGAGEVVYNTFSAFTGPGDPMILMTPVDSGEERALELEGTNVHCLPTGHLVFAQGGSLVAAPFDAKSGELLGAPTAVVADVLTNTNGVAQYDVSDTGTLVYLRGGEQLPERRLVWVDREGASVPAAEEIRSFWGPRLAPDGSAVSTWIDGNPPHVWIHDSTRGSLTRLTSEGLGFWSLWSPDSRHLAFVSWREEEEYSIGWQPVDRSAPQETLVKLPTQPLSWSPDGRTLLIQMPHNPKTGFDLAMVNLDDGSEPRPVVDSPANEFQGILSRDGSWLAYVSDESGRREVYVKPFPSLTGTTLISTQGGEEPLWSPSGRELFYRNEGRVLVVDIRADPHLRASRPRVLFEDRFIPGTPYGRNWDIDSSGERFVMVESANPPPTATEIVVVQNWFEELRRLVPSRP